MLAPERYRVVEPQHFAGSRAVGRAETPGTDDENPAAITERSAGRPRWFGAAGGRDPAALRSGFLDKFAT